MRGLAPFLIAAALTTFGCGESTTPPPAEPDAAPADAASPSDADSMGFDADPMLGDARITPAFDAGMIGLDAAFHDGSVLLLDAGLNDASGLPDDATVGELTDSEVPLGCGGGCPPMQRCCPTGICLPAPVPCP